MKKVIISILALSLAIFTITFSSCASVKKDCNGVKHYKHTGGFYI